MLKVFLILIVLLVSNGLAGEMQHAEWPAPATIELRQEPGGSDVPFGVDAGVGVWVDQESKKRTGSLAIGPTRSALLRKGWPHDWHAGLSMRHRGLRRGDLVPMLGAVYRVDSLSNGQGKYGDKMSLERVENADLPESIVPARDSLLFPNANLAQDEKTTYWKSQLYNSTLVAIRVDQEGDEPPKALVQTVYSGPVGRNPTGITYRTPKLQTVSKGDDLVVEGRVHEVRNVVPADPERRIRGWIELAPRPTERDRKPE